MLFCNYIFLYILKTIIEYIYSKFEITIYIPIKPFTNNNEVIQYALVSKYFFSLVSKILSSQLSFKNYIMLKGLIETAANKSNFKLIKRKDSKIYYSLVQDYIMDYKTGRFGENVFNKVLISSGYNIDSINILRSISIYPSNFRFDLLCSLSEFTENFKFVNYEKDLEKIKVLKTTDCNSLVPLYNFLKRVGLKSIVYTDFYCENGISFSFEFKSTQNNKITIDNIFFPKECISNSSSSVLSKLDHFVLSIKAKRLLKVSNSYFEGESKKKLWDHIISCLLNQPTLCEFVYNHGCRSGLCFCNLHGIEVPDITKGCRAILSSPLNRIKTFIININDEIDINLVEGIKENKTVSKLVLTGASRANTIANILLINRTIRHLVYYNSEDFLNLLLILKQPSFSSIELYSISNIFDINLNLNLTLDLIKSYHYSINEFNLIHSYDFLNNNKSLNFQIVSHHNTIINVSRSYQN
ncbi:hypothetical protein DICPUDRAFT_149766 [Dictyostelium purpureum]|uniref:Uncharacterized protein n=1 Tax=Dictyostelium purpureum TaxID=5786 RepID=F0ZEL7_DICPU|nr:uncharacterized protein DICPUDRAFT_149766 [Dictyostelium purpureum]EGC37611.1 hypothetical protein DICPUDRAFT_149766 [Dictyostelium purpureum]|eukprot:XP_003285872.1 hypothetical protein DICPUDRAFT_149766 [Dictyostelium purpureum]